MSLWPAALAFLSIWTLKVSAQNPTSTISSGVIIGTTSVLTSGTATATIDAFLGVPYAKPPVPPNRFTPPEPPTAWSTPLITQNFGNSCMQEFNPVAVKPFVQSVFDVPPPRHEDEDCLYLNVWAPKGRDATPRPVMYWIYGGALHFGYNGLPIYNGSHFAAFEDVIIVSVNYRTNVFGFPSSPEIPNNQKNLGFLDQRLGLDWVQQNIAAFGGDPTRVTIFGQSAGGYSVDAMLTGTFNGTVPFSSAIMQSGQLSYSLMTIGPDTTASWNNLSASLGCGSGATSLNCVKQASHTQEQIQQILENNDLNFAPVIDEMTLVSNPNTKHNTSTWNKVPILTGSNAQDGSFYAVFYAQSGIDQYLATYGFTAAGLSEAIKNEYHVTSANATYATITQIHTDWFFQCPSKLMANHSSSQVPTWRYYFNATFNNTEAPYTTPGAWHTSEIPIVFSTYPSANAEPEEINLSNTMRRAWANFAKDPNGAGPGWTRYIPKITGLESDLDLQDFGTDGKGGVAIIPESTVDGHCDHFWDPLLQHHTN